VSTVRLDIDKAHMNRHDAHEPGVDANRAQATVSLSRTAWAAALHCLTGCAIGEVLGMVIGTAL